MLLGKFAGTVRRELPTDIYYSSNSLSQDISNPFIRSLTVMPKFSNKSFAKTLLKLPVEIAQQILGYVPFYRVLVIAVCLEGTYLREPFEDLVLSLRFQKIFSADDGTLMCMIDLYKIYLELLQFIKQYTRLPNLYKLTLSMGFDELWPHDVPYLKTIRRRQYDELSYEVRHMLQSLRWSESFQPFVELPRHRDFLLLDCYKEYWRAVRDKHSQFAARRYSQLQTLAGIFRKYHTFLKKSSDPGLDARPNYTHILNRLERCAEQYQKDVLKPRSRRHSSLYHHHHLPILPLDKYLLLFVHTLAQYPYQCSCSFPEVKNHGIVGLSINSENAPQSLIYPSHIQEEISRVIHGLKEVYTSEAVVSGCLPSKYVVIRTKFTPYSGVRLSKLPTISACRFPVTGK